jgi:hypothetical protein
MSRRYRITRSFQANEDEVASRSITLEECKRYFATQPEFAYTPVYTVKGGGGAASMSIEGDFFLWSHGDALIPFRHYDGDLYVSGANDAVIPKMVEVASALVADIEEG